MTCGRLRLGEGGIVRWWFVGRLSELGPVCKCTILNHRDRDSRETLQFADTTLNVMMTRVGWYSTHHSFIITTPTTSCGMGSTTYHCENLQHIYFSRQLMAAVAPTAVVVIDGHDYYRECNVVRWRAVAGGEWGSELSWIELSWNIYRFRLRQWRGWTMIARATGKWEQNYM